MVEYHLHTGSDSPQLTGRALLNAPRDAIADPTGGAVVDAEARTAINSIILALEKLQLIRE